MASQPECETCFQAKLVLAAVGVSKLCCVKS